MFGRNGLDRFKKAETLEPFSVTISSSSKSASLTSFQSLQTQNSQAKGQCTALKPVAPELTSSGVAPPAHTTLVGGGQSNWQPPDWAIEPIPGVYYLDVLKDGEILDRIDLDKRRHIFGRQFPMCDFVLDHQSVSRQHAAVVPHKNGSIYVIDLGSAHGTFVANERLTKDSPVELEVGQSLRFAASTRSYILRKNNAAFFPTSALPSEVTLPSPPDPSDEEAVLSYNTILNRFGVRKPDSSSKLSKDFMAKSCSTDDGSQGERASKILRKSRVSFSDQLGGNLIEVVGISDGADVETEPGPVGVKEGSLVGKYESLVQTTMIPKGKEQISPSCDNSASGKGVTNKLQEVLNKVKAAPKIGIYDDLYGDSFSGKVGSSWAYRSSEVIEGSPRGTGGKSPSTSNEKSNASAAYDEEDDLFGDSLED